MALSILNPRSNANRYPALEESNKEACTDFLCRLVRTPSLSGQEASVARLVLGELAAAGLTNVHTDRTGNIIGRYGKPGGPILLLNAHMDTVDVGDPDAWTRDPFGGDIIDGYVHGRGSTDMKGALAAMVYGVGLLARRGIELPGEVVLAAVVQEEPTEGMAMRVLVQEEGLRPDWVVLGEPTSLQLARGQRGRMEIWITIQGRSAHASSPDEGENALAGAARLIFGLEILNENLMADAALGKASLAVTGLTSVASSRNAIPDRCDLIVDRRLTLGETAARALAEVEATMRRDGIRGRVEVGRYRSISYTGYETEGAEIYPAWLLSEDHPLLQQAMVSLDRSLGRRPSVGIWSFSTDGVYTMGEAGIPTIGFGPGDARLAHTADERIRVVEVHRAADAYAALVIDLLDSLARRP